MRHKYVWNKDKVDAYQSRLNSDVTTQNLNLFSTHVNTAASNVDIDNCISELSNVLDGVVSPIFKRTLVQNDGDVCTSSVNKWFTTECQDKRQLFYAALNVYRSIYI